MASISTSPPDGAVVRTLPNGMPVLLEPLPHLRSVSAGLWVKTGSANESAEWSGVSHFLEHLFFKGTSTRTARQLMEAIERRGGQLNAFTSRDYTCVYVRVLDTHVESGLEIVADVIKDSQFFDFEKERNVILEEIASIVDVPEDYVHDLFVERLWPDHPLGRSVSGSGETVARLTPEDVRAYYNRWYRPENMIFAAAGNFDVETVYDQVAGAFGPLTAGAAPEPYDAPRFGAGVHIVERDISQSHLCFGFPGPDVLDPSRYAYDVLCCTLGGGSTSRLFDRIRENEGLAYSIYSFNSCYLRSGLVGVYAAVAPDNLERTLELAFEEVRKFRETPVSAEELDGNREQLKGNLLMSLENTFNRMSRMARSVMYHGRILPIDEIVAAVDAVTAEDLQRVALETFTRDNCAMVVFGPSYGRTAAEVAL